MKVELIDTVKVIAYARNPRRNEQAIAKVYGKTRTLSDAFIVPRKRGSSKTTVYVRKSSKRLPLKMPFGPGIMQLFRQCENDAIMQARVQERFKPEFHRNLAFYLNRYK